VELRDADVLSLLDGQYSFTVVVEGDEPKERDPEDMSEDATQLDLAALEEFERHKWRSKAGSNGHVTTI